MPDSFSSTPSLHTLRAAVRVIRCLGPDGIDSTNVRRAYRALPTDGVFSLSDFVAAEALLVELRLVIQSAERLVPERLASLIAATTEMAAVEILLDRILSLQRPLWLTSAVVGDELREELIPDSELIALKSSVREFAMREGLLLVVRNRNDPTPAPLGNEMAQEFVVRGCRECLLQRGLDTLPDAVQGLGGLGTDLGFDVVSPTVGHQDVHIAAKEVAAEFGEVIVHLTRNESTMAMRDPRWRLAMCRASDSEGVRFLGWCMPAAVIPLLPSDRSKRGRWTGARVVLSPQDLRPSLETLLTD